MNNITPIFKLADILHTPKGIALGGAFSSSQHLEDALGDIKQNINGLDSLTYFDSSQKLISLSVKEVQYTNSIGDGINLFLLLDCDHLPNDLTLGTTIYRNKQSDIASSPKLSTSAI